MAGRYGVRDAGQIERISIHHSVTSEPQTYEEELDAMTTIGRFHIFTRGWEGYAYHWTIAASGRTYYTGDMTTIRYIVGNDNPYNVGICLLGTFMDHAPTPAALEALRLLIGEIQFSLGRKVPYFGHRDTPGADQTACPGDTYLQWLPDLAGDTETGEASIRAWTRDEIIDGLLLAADERAVPRRLILGAAVAESGLNQFSEHIGKWPDVSYGLGSQTVRFAPVGDKTDTPANRALVRDWLFDPANAIPLMADKLAANFFDPNNPGVTEEDRIRWALWRYNAGSFRRPPAANVTNYERGLTAADDILNTLVPEEEDVQLTDQERADLTHNLGVAWGLVQKLRAKRDRLEGEQAIRAIKVITGLEG